ncbi:glutamate racemase [Caldimonas tepidiphila]|uniref:glutamate racemase n=1 Tax=Caldimonas tepidiphila TaxID=2315841 RepID=UPI001F0BDEAC|nr:glutamate racemase [Caldimonas tepidiphila]
MRTEPPTSAAARPEPMTVGVFDSGVGGLSVLRALHRELPGARLVYVADSGYAPYGERPRDYVLQRSQVLTEFLQAQGARVIVIACNTATAAAGQWLREHYPDTCFVGVEPGLKPAVTASRNRIVGVMATQGTLASEKFQALRRPLEAQTRIVTQACTGLAGALERGDPQAGEVQELVRRHCAPLREAGVDTVVLGCTHYPFATDAIQRELGPSVLLIDTAEAIARHTVTQVRRVHGALPSPDAPDGVSAYTSGPVAVLEKIAEAWLDFPMSVQALP